MSQCSFVFVCSVYNLFLFSYLVSWDLKVCEWEKRVYNQQHSLHVHLAIYFALVNISCLSLLSRRKASEQTKKTHRSTCNTESRLIGMSFNNVGRLFLSTLLPLLCNSLHLWNFNRCCCWFFSLFILFLSLVELQSKVKKRYTEWSDLIHTQNG